MDTSSWTPMTFVRVLGMGLYVWAGELHWIWKKGGSRLKPGLNDETTLNAWRQAQIEQRIRLFSLDKA